MPSPPTLASTTLSAPTSSFTASAVGSNASSSPTTRPVTRGGTTSNPTISAAAYASATAVPRHQIQYSPANPFTHIAAVVAPSYAAPRAAPRLPRTSSLLPPPTSLDAASRSPAALLAAQLKSELAPIAHSPPSHPPPAPPVARRLSVSHTHSRSNSTGGGGGPSDGAKNLHRWSASSTSSRTSVINYGSVNPDTSTSTPGRGTASHSRRRSVDIALHSSPRKLQKNRRPSTSAGSHRRTESNDSTKSKQSEPSFTFVDLPPIVPLSSLEFDVQEGTSLLSAAEISTARPIAQQPPPPGPNAIDERTRAPASDEQYSKRTGPSTTTTTTPLSKKVQVERPKVPAAAGSMSTMVPSRPAMVYERNGETVASKGHSRNKSQPAKGSSDTTSSRGKERSGKPPSQKAMLSKALQKANTAVQLDNAQNFEGAREAYAEACDLLQQVLNRTAGDEDKRKLEAIRRTYTTRIEDLDQMAPLRKKETGKALPARPDKNGQNPSVTVGDEEEDEMDEYAVIETATVTRIGGRSPVQGPTSRPHNGALATGASQDKSRPAPSMTLAEPRPLQSSFSRSPVREAGASAAEQYLSNKTTDGGIATAGFGSDNADGSPPAAGTNEPASWLDPIDESGASSPSSVHSRSSSTGVRRKHIRAASGTTEAEFDAALDAAVEAAYDDGYEPMDEDEMVGQAQYLDGDQVVANALRRVELAKERVRQTELEAKEQEQERERRRIQQEKEREAEYEPPDFYEGDSSEEEERMFEEMSKGYSIDDFSLRNKQSVGRGSDSSAFTSRTWNTSSGSNPPTATTLSTVIEGPPPPLKTVNGMPPPPPPEQALPELPPQTGKAAPSQQQAAASSKESVRNRRLSGQNPKQLKIETAGLSQGRQAPSAVSAVEKRAPPKPGASPTRSAYPPSPPLTYPAAEEEAESPLRSDSPTGYMPMLRTTYSETSLRSFGSRNMSTSRLDDASELSPGTPLSGIGAAGGVLGNIPNLPTPLAASFREKMGADVGGGLFLFDDNIHSPYSPGSPNPLMADAPVALEPCPNDFLLRPFWLMRCLYQTLAHPRGGYVSSKLFVPRDVWRVKGVRIRNMEEKIANCDYLTAALLKLAQVDTCDADAVLEEMQSLEGVLEKAQASLSKKLGAEVGVPSAGALFKDTGALGDDDASSVPRSGSVTGGKSSGGGSAFSWRRLRTKNSAVGLGSAYLASNNSSGTGLAGGGRDGDGGKDGLTMQTLPMTSHPTSRPSKRDLSTAQFSGPNKEYMDSLARLFDAAQALDEIARQVEDPGLRASDKTQVGLELCARHAAEFFSFYILRFVLADLSMLLEKFVKRGSEWVLV